MLLRILKAVAIAAFATSLSAPLAAQDATDTFVRVNRLENQVRQLSGQIEQLQFENKRLQEQLKRFQEDVEFRFQERGGSRPNAGSAPPATRPTPAPTAAPTPITPQRRSDVFDPTLDPTAPGVPRPLGTTPPTPDAGLARVVPPDDEEPLVIGGRGPGAIIADDGDLDDEGAIGQPLDVGALSRTGSLDAGAPRGPSSIAATGEGSARQMFDRAMQLYETRQYEAAEMGFRQFLQSFPRDRLVADATFYLGESYYQRQRFEDAGQQFLKVSTEHARSPRAPDALLRLGMSLNAIGAREQACATFAKVGREYPQVADGVRRSLDREQRRARCTA